MGAHSPAGEGLGESHFRRLEKKLSTPSTYSEALTRGGGGELREKGKGATVHKAGWEIPIGQDCIQEICCLDLINTFRNVSIRVNTLDDILHCDLAHSR